MSRWLTSKRPAFGRMLLLGLLLSAGGSQGQTRTIVVCAPSTVDAKCDFSGNEAIQQSVDSAANGDIILLRKGTFSPIGHRDIPFQDVVIRGYVVIDGKDLSIQGEEGAVLDGAAGIPSTAFVVRNADVQFRNVDIRNFRWAVEEDKIYDGHGVFAIDSRVRLRDVTLEKLVKMSLTGRGDTLIDADRIKILAGHLGVWLEESAHAHIRNALIQGGDSAAVATYMNASATIHNSVIQGNTDDGLYAKGHSSIFVTNSILLGNKPYAINAEGKARITVVNSVVHGNALNVNPKVPKEQLILGKGIIEADPLLDGNFKPRQGSPLIGKTDPDLGRAIGIVEAL